MTKLRLALKYQKYRDGEQLHAGALQAAAWSKIAVEKRNAQATQLFFDAATYTAIPRAYPRPSSRWTANEKQFYEKILAAGSYDVLVAPLQVDGAAAFDRAGRSLMTAELAAAAAKTQRGTVSDTFLMDLARFATTDRVPSRELATEIVDLDHATWQFDTGARSVVRPDADARELQILGPAGAVTPAGLLSIALFDHGGPKHRVRSDSSFFVAGYRALKMHEYREARRVFDEAATLYDMASPPASYMLPYYALASARAGADVSNVEVVLGRFGPTERLALTQYTYGDICEALYQLTGHGGFREEALDWARSREKAEPWLITRTGNPHTSQDSSNPRSMTR
jgi:hypothetical protein